MKKEGHLVTIDDKAEYQKIVNQKLLNECKNICFYVGGSRNLSEEKFYWNNEKRKHYGTALNCLSSWSSGYWREGEPSIAYKNVPKCYMSIEWESSSKQWRFNDMITDVISRNFCYYMVKIFYGSEMK